MIDKERHIAVIGLGYVGWPLYMLLSSKFDCWGLDGNVQKVEDIHSSYPQYQNITASWDDIKQCDTFIVAVPTPIDENKHPDTSSLKSVCIEISKVIKNGDIVIFESTVFPGATEELCIPIIESGSGLSLNNDFFVGYSPERINVGDPMHKLDNTPKIVSASSNDALPIIANLYETIINAPIVRASSIKIAEAAKMYENVQRDVLIALANEYSEFCSKEGIDILEVTKCASTKWNFANVLPGLVGGHCIGIDPYYLLHRAEQLGVDIPFVHCGRKVNESKPLKVAKKIIKFISEHTSPNEDLKILILGFSYKANTADIRNTKVAEVYNKLKERYPTTDCYDPFVDIGEAKKEYGIALLDVKPDIDKYDYVIRMVNHNCFESLALNNVVELSSLI